MCDLDLRIFLSSVYLLSIQYSDIITILPTYFSHIFFLYLQQYMLHHILEFISQQTIKQVLNLLCVPCRFPHHLECNILFVFLVVGGGGGS